MRTHEPSRTAIKSARILVYLSKEPENASLLSPGAADWTKRLLLEAGLLKPWMVSLFEKSWYQSFLAYIDRHLMPGQTLEYGLRKRFFEEETRQAIAEGASQVLSIGAGFDTLCLRLAREYPEVSFVEIDHPANHRIKRTATKSLGALEPNLYHLGVDLASVSLGDALAALAIWHPEAQSVVIAEAVLMYLKPDAVLSIFQDIHKSTGAQSTLLFSYMRADAHGNISVGPYPALLKTSLKIIGEPLLWGISPKNLKNLLLKNGYEPNLSSERCDLGFRYLAPLGRSEESLGGVEFLALARTI